jgi:hypothetical protein
MRSLLRAAAFLAAAGSASAQTLTTIPAPFVGDRSETFEHPNTNGACVSNGVFESPGGTDWLASLCAVSGTVLVSQGWSFSCNIAPHGGLKFCGSAGGALQLDFSLGGQDATKFGGYFGSNSPGSSGVNAMTVRFYDGLGAQIGTDQYVQFPGCGQYTWAGWQITGGAARRITITGNYGSGGFVDIDDLEAAFNSGAPPPTVYCTAGTTTNGCAASIAASDNPNVGHANSCLLSVSGVEGQKSGILFYGLTQNIQPWCSVGGNSLLCVKAPTQRTVAQPSGGTFGACDGTLALDWNAWQNANAGALGQPFAAGANVYVQGWFRDPPACKTTSMTDAVEMTYVP